MSLLGRSSNLCAETRASRRCGSDPSLRRIDRRRIVHAAGIGAGMVRGVPRYRHRLMAGATMTAVVAGGWGLSTGTARSAEQDHAAHQALAAATSAAQVTVG